MSEQQARIEADVEVTVADGCDAITRYTDPKHEFYEFWEGDHTTSAVTAELARLCVALGVEDAARLDGWGDLERGQCTMRITWTDVAP